MIQPAWATPDELVVLALALPPLAVVAAALTRGRALALLGFVAAAPTALLGILPPRPGPWSKPNGCCWVRASA